MLYEKLNYILTIAEEQNLTRAAKRLFISQPSLTLYLNKLEAELGVKLFDRSRSPIVLTDAGNYYIAQMKKIASAEQLLRNDIKMIANPIQTFAIGIGLVRGQDWLPATLPAFCAIHPDVNIKAMLQNEVALVENIHNHSIDLAIGVLPVSGTDLETVDLSMEDLCIVAHPRFGLIPPEKREYNSVHHPYVIQPEELSGLPFITPHVSNGMYDSYETMMLEGAIKPSRTIEVNDLRIGLECVVRGLGVQLIPTSVFPVVVGKPQIDQLDFCRLQKLDVTRKCIAAFDAGNIKIQLIHDFIRIVQTEVIQQL
jgi:DNA-binding transcriptional LysR family regulator